MANRNLSYFKYTHPVHYVWIITGLYLVWMSAYAPDAIPWYFGPLKTVATYLGKNYNEMMKITWYLAMLAHISEGIFAAFIARKYDLNWVCAVAWGVQTLITGAFSLTLLLKYDSNHKSHARNASSKTK